MSVTKIEAVKARDYGGWAKCGHATYESTTIVTWAVDYQENALCLRCAKRVAAFVESLNANHD